LILFNFGGFFQLVRMCIAAAATVDVAAVGAPPTAPPLSSLCYR
jgi:hypothetical protein